MLIRTPRSVRHHAFEGKNGSVSRLRDGALPRFLLRLNEVKNKAKHSDVFTFLFFNDNKKRKESWPMSTSLRTRCFGSPPPPRLFSITAILLFSTYFLLHPDVQLSKPLTSAILPNCVICSLPQWCFSSYFNIVFSLVGIFGLKSAPHVHYLGQIDSNHELKLVYKCDAPLYF